MFHGTLGYFAERQIINMQKKEFIMYTRKDNYPILYRNRNFNEVLSCIAFKYGFVVECYNGIKIPKIKQAKKFIIEKCWEDLKVKISYKQIARLVKPQRMEVPYTSIVIIETIYNLLKDSHWNDQWKLDFEKYLKNSMSGQEYYESFLLKDIPELIFLYRDEFMNSPYSQLFRCFADSRQKFNDSFENITMIEHWERNFPSSKFDKKDIPNSIYEYQMDRVYLR